ncbi:MmcB family DNA repair protein [Brucella pseudogrignonensis]|nr:MmcB family DNA repair protein [Brucella pseudogrignonensis]
MPIVIPNKTHPLSDGRQSENAMLVRRGVQRLFLEMGLATLPELSLASGRRADLIAVNRKGEIWIVEIKSSIEDWKADRKWPDYRAYCDRLFFATHPSVPSEIFPEDCGFILSDGYGAEILRDAPEHKLPGATRKALILRFARSSAARLTIAELAGLDVPETDID